jgi:toxin HigB-1
MVPTVIQSFADRDSEKVYQGRRVKRFEGFRAAAERKLAQLDAATSVEDLRVPPGNRLEALVGDRSGQYSIRINDQWRVCFRWTSNGPADVQIADYH